MTIAIGDRLVIERHLRDWATELNDQAPLTSSVTRACRLYVGSGLALEAFLDAMREARRRTQEHSGGIRQPLRRGGASGLTKPKVGYFFAVLEDLCGRGAGAG